MQRCVAFFLRDVYQTKIIKEGEKERKKIDEKVQSSLTGKVTRSSVGRNFTCLRRTGEKNTTGRGKKNLFSLLSDGPFFPLLLLILNKNRRKRIRNKALADHSWLNN